MTVNFRIESLYFKTMVFILVGSLQHRGDISTGFLNILFESLELNCWVKEHSTRGSMPHIQ